jgi:hypothetical protein
MMSCDHHDENRGIPDNRSRKRILEQFDAAITLGDAFRALALGSTITVNLVAPQGLLSRPTITIDLGQFQDAWAAYMVWFANQPRGDDLAPPVAPPAEIHVPDLDGPADTSAASE